MSPETITVLKSLVLAKVATVPITSSASYLSTEYMGIEKDLTTFSRIGICSVNSKGAGGLPALYSGYSSCLNVGPFESIANII